MKYLSEMEEDQTLVMNSGHPLGLFPSHREAPRVVVTNGMMIPNYSSKEMFEKLSAMGVTMYGQMTAGSYCYIDSCLPPPLLFPTTTRLLPRQPRPRPRPRPQGIVHGTTITVLNAGRKYLGLEDLSGRVYVTSGLGGMSGAQAKAAVISGTIGVVAEVDEAPLRKRYEQGWVREVITDLDELVTRIRAARQGGEVTSIGFHGNIVAVWERLAEEEDLLADLGSDQTSLHNPFNGGYYPVQVRGPARLPRPRGRATLFRTCTHTHLPLSAPLLVDACPAPLCALRARAALLRGGAPRHGGGPTALPRARSRVPASPHCRGEQADCEGDAVRVAAAQAGSPRDLTAAPAPFLRLPRRPGSGTTATACCWRLHAPGRMCSSPAAPQPPRRARR